MRLLNFSEFDSQLYILLLDKLHPNQGGNKYFKLKYNLEEARKQGQDTILTFGGAYSNHILATSFAGKKFGFQTIGIIRGEEESVSNPTLTEASGNGMKLYFISREEYKKKEGP
ncbi:MAG TPA: hypothetical protein VNX68_09570, partial [Nitrosopumilaceae archaeon]|nr:hypothetical protein [Nitrosopumilaceae archaeon]